MPPTADCTLRYSIGTRCPCTEHLITVQNRTLQLQKQQLRYGSGTVRRERADRLWTWNAGPLGGSIEQLLIRDLVSPERGPRELGRSESLGKVSPRPSRNRKNRAHRGKEWGPSHRRMKNFEATPFWRVAGGTSYSTVLLRSGALIDSLRLRRTAARGPPDVAFSPRAPISEALFFFLAARLGCWPTVAAPRLLLPLLGPAVVRRGYCTKHRVSKVV